MGKIVAVRFFFFVGYIIVQRSNNLFGMIVILLFIQMSWPKDPYTIAHICIYIYTEDLTSVLVYF